MRFSYYPLLLGLSLGLMGPAHAAPSMETSSTPFDFDGYKRNPLQGRNATPISSKPGRDLQSQLISGQAGREDGISKRASDLFPSPESIPLRPEPVVYPTPNELIDEVTAERSAENTRGQKDLLVRGKVAKELNLSAMSESDYQLFVSQRKNASRDNAPAKQASLNPMPTVTNLKTGGPAHAYSVTTPGIRPKGNDQNPFEDVIKAMRLDTPITKGTDPLPKTIASSKQSTAPKATEATPDASSATPANQSSSDQPASSATP